MTESKPVSLPHDPNCHWCAAGIEPRLAQITAVQKGREMMRRGAASATTTASSPAAMSTEAARCSTSGICSIPSSSVKADPIGASSTTATGTSAARSSIRAAGQPPREQPVIANPPTPTRWDGTLRGGLTPSQLRASDQAAEEVGVAGS